LSNDVGDNFEGFLRERYVFLEAVKQMALQGKEGTKTKKDEKGDLSYLYGSR